MILKKSKYGNCRLIIHYNVDQYVDRTSRICSKQA